MADITLEANFNVSAKAIADKATSYHGRVVELLANAIANDPLGTHDHLEAAKLARALHTALNAYPGIVQQVRNELHI
jgi:hypothetical protein